MTYPKNTQLSPIPISHTQLPPTRKTQGVFLVVCMNMILAMDIMILMMVMISIMISCMDMIVLVWYLCWRCCALFDGYMYLVFSECSIEDSFAWHWISLMNQYRKERKVDGENCQFQDNWLENYYFIQNKGLIVCLLCNESVSVNKKYNSRRHFTSRPADHQKNYGQLQEDEIQKLKKLDTKQQMFDKHSIVKTSFVISKRLLAILSHFVKENLSKMSAECCKYNIAWWKEKYLQIFVYQMYCCPTFKNGGWWYKKCLKEKIAMLEVFSIALDNSINASDTAQLTVQGVDVDFNITRIIGPSADKKEQILVKIYWNNQHSLHEIWA